ncbi:hypothetical protein ABIC28_000460 [Rhodococcus sp. PvR044]|uniref:hypothetical protein n=1 Tax=Rhodococcus TaxID=1827 RepID=UPI001AE8D832|nr:MULTISPECIES: hypothetical protein [Rhodococcus]MBP1162925.1 hypothetical protein [Rhodococcus sp. PvR099]MCZ4554740.1 hypothetical protein [Rhodococcus maanshanensis]
MNTKVMLLRVIPVLGWIYLVAGLIRPSGNRVARALWWIDVVLSVGAHAAQIPAALKEGRARGHSDVKIAAMTMLLGATWWRTQ